MSLAGPHGEAACRYCGHLVDLNADRKLTVHHVGLNRARCEGSATYAHTRQEKEFPELAFSSEPVVRRCPVCETDVQVTTIGQARTNWRFDAHYRKPDQPTSGWCPGTGTPVNKEAPLNENPVTIHMYGGF